MEANLTKRKHAAEARWYGVALGNWATRTLRSDDGRELVLAVDERTLLAVVFRLLPVERFRESFALALRSILEDLRIPQGTITRETDAIALEPIGAPVPRAMNEPLSNLKYICEIELMYHADLRKVQWNLNDFPHGNRLPCVSKEAVVELLRSTVTIREPLRH